MAMFNAYLLTCLGCLRRRTRSITNEWSPGWSILCWYGLCLMRWVKLLQFHKCIKIDGDVYNCRCAILPASASQWAQKTWSCWCNANGTSSDWTAACTDTRCQTVTSSSQYGNVNKDTCQAEVAFSWRPIQGSKRITSQRFPATWHE